MHKTKTDKTRHTRALVHTVRRASSPFYDILAVRGATTAAHPAHHDAPPA